MSGLCSLLELRFVMRGAAAHRLQRLAWFLFFFLVLLLNNAMSQGEVLNYAMSQDAGGQELAHVAEDSHSSPLIVGAGGGEHEQQLSRLGSRPPFCERKCGGCAPCTAVQVRAPEGQLRPQCANYEPVGWKCKCGAAIFDP